MASNTNPAFATTSLVPICNFLVAFLCPNVPFFPCIWLLLTNHASIYLKPFSSDKKQQKKKKFNYITELLSHDLIWN